MTDSKGSVLSNTAHEYAECSAKVRGKRRGSGVPRVHITPQPQPPPSRSSHIS
jgi:hypothetical protein